MNYPKYIIFFLLTILLTSFSFRKIDYREARNLNICKELRNDVLVYMIFIDTKTTTPWTEFDIQSTMDSLNTALRWIRNEAERRNIPLKFKTDYYIGDQYTTIKKNLPFESVNNSVHTPNLKKGFEGLNNWADNIAKKAGGSFYITEKDGIPGIKKPKNKERLVAFLRDEHNVESVVLLYMVNNYYKKDISLPVNILNTDDIEFAIVSYKYPSEIGHNILHMFGAIDLYKTPYRRNSKKNDKLEGLFGKDIMKNPTGKNIHKMNIGEFTEYQIGWKKTLSPDFQEFLFDKKKNFN